MSKLQLSFHSTFALKKDDLAKVLRAATEDKGLNDTLENLSLKTKLGKKKFSAMKSWATRSGLLREDYLSPEGEMALNKDPYLESIVTDWVIHFYLSFGTRSLQRPPENPSDWGGWSYFIYTFLPEHEIFDLDKLVLHSSSFFQQETDQQLKENLRIVLRAYTEKQALSGCNLLKKINNRFQKSKIDLSDRSVIYVVGYILAQLWERDFRSSQSVLVEEVLEQPLGIIQVLGISRNEFQTILKNLEEKEIIAQRSAKPYLLGTTPEQRNDEEHIQIIRRWDNPLSLLEKAYDEDQSRPNQPLSKVLEPFLDEDEGNLPCLEWSLGYLFILPYTA